MCYTRSLPLRPELLGQDRGLFLRKTKGLFWSVICAVLGGWGGGGGRGDSLPRTVSPTVSPMGPKNAGSPGRQRQVI